MKLIDAILNWGLVYHCQLVMKPISLALYICGLYSCTKAFKYTIYNHSLQYFECGQRDENLFTDISFYSCVACSYNIVCWKVGLHFVKIRVSVETLRLCLGVLRKNIVQSRLWQNESSSFTSLSRLTMVLLKVRALENYGLPAEYYGAVAVG